MSKGRCILKNDRFGLTMRRLAQQLVEDHGDLSQACIIGLQPRGILFSDRIVEILTQEHRLKNIRYGQLDITFYRDDFRRRDKPIAASETKMDFLVEDLNVILVDDVLYTGRTVQAALSALQDYGRAQNVQLMALVDRRFNRHLPIQADYKGLMIDSMDEAYVKVCWSGIDKQDEIIMYPRQKTQSS